MLHGTFVDSSILLDVFTEDARWYEWSEAHLVDAAERGPLALPLLTRDPRRVATHIPGVELIRPSG